MSFFSSGFPFGGGFFDQGMFGGHAPQDDEPVDNEGYYNLLGVAKNASKNEIHKAYLKLARTKHPDKGGSHEEFQAITQAHDVLYDEEKRQIYDKYGVKGINEGMGGRGGGPTDIFDLLNGRSGRSGGRDQVRRGPDVQFPLKVTLEDLYNGKTSKIAIQRDRNCTECGGAGGKDVRQCSECKGKGKVVRMEQIGPGMYTQSAGPCRTCKGQGRVVEAKNMCKSCKGNRVLKERKVIEVQVDKGAPNKHKVTYAGESDEAPGLQPGDLIVILTESEHSVFKRKKADLVMTKTITLKQALTGFSFDITHLDGSTKIIRSSEGDVIKPGDVRTIMELGMPIMRTPWRFGNLFIYYEVEFPAPGSLSLEQRQALLQALPGENMDLEAQEGQETHSAVPFEKQHVTENSTRIHSDYNEDEEDDDPRFSGARQVQCSGTIF